MKSCLFNFTSTADLKMEKLDFTEWVWHWQWTNEMHLIYVSSFYIVAYKGKHCHLKMVNSKHKKYTIDTETHPSSTPHSDSEAGYIIVITTR